MSKTFIWPQNVTVGEGMQTCTQEYLIDVLVEHDMECLDHAEALCDIIRHGAVGYENMPHEDLIAAYCTYVVDRDFNFLYEASDGVTKIEVKYSDGDFNFDYKV